jgi:hypothetical protein
VEALEELVDNLEFSVEALETLDLAVEVLGEMVEKALEENWLQHTVRIS